MGNKDNFIKENKSLKIKGIFNANTGEIEVDGIPYSLVELYQQFDCHNVEITFASEDYKNKKE